MIESILAAAAVLLWGGLVGLVYFGGLWLTVARLTKVKHQALWMLSSFVIRNLTAVAGFYPVVLMGWRPALYCLAGFILVRFVLVRRIRPQAC